MKIQQTLFIRGAFLAILVLGIGTIFAQVQSTREGVREHGQLFHRVGSLGINTNQMFSQNCMGVNAGENEEPCLNVDGDANFNNLDAKLALEVSTNTGGVNIATSSYDNSQRFVLGSGNLWTNSFDTGSVCANANGILTVCGEQPQETFSETYSWNEGNWGACSSSSAGSCSGSWIKNNGITTTTDTGIHCDDEDGGRGDICNYEEGASFCHLNTLYECDNEKVYCNKNSASACTTQNSACSWTNAASSSQSRTVTCVSSTNATVSDSNCPGSKPSVSQSCTSVGTWQTTPAASCSTACGQSATTKYGSVYCSGGNCDQSTKPSRPSRQCNATASCTVGLGESCSNDNQCGNNAYCKTVYKYGRSLQGDQYNNQETRRIRTGRGTSETVNNQRGGSTTTSPGGFFGLSIDDPNCFVHEASCPSGWSKTDSSKSSSSDQCDAGEWKWDRWRTRTIYFCRKATDDKICVHSNYGKSCKRNDCTGNWWLATSGTTNIYGSCIGSRCKQSFIAGTKITMADGTLKNIELLKKGDKVMSSSGETVVEKIHKYTTEEAVYSLNGSRYFVTGSHPFMTLGGWKSFHPENTRRKVPEIKVSQLKIGDTLLRENGESELLEKFDSINGTHEVYNLRVKGSHDFYADGYWVHNK